MKFLLGILILFTNFSAFSSNCIRTNDQFHSHRNEPTTNNKYKSGSLLVKSTGNYTSSNWITDSETDEFEDQDNDDCSEKTVFKTNNTYTRLQPFQPKYKSGCKYVDLPLKRLFILLMVFRL